MKKAFLTSMSLIVLCICFTATGCSEKKPSSIDSTNIDSIVAADTVKTDSAENLIAETPMPKAADELFDDFIFNFSANKKLQHERIHFPLPVYRNGKVEKSIAKTEWKMEHFFMRQGYYTLIFDNRKQMNLVKDTTIDHVIIEKVFFKIKTVKQYLFNRINGRWMMTSVNLKPMFENNNASFLKFYQHFAVDTAFQSRHLASTIKFTGPDPDDDFSTMTGDIDAETWPAFAPKLPAGMIYNIVYGQKYAESTQKIFVIRGIANGMETELTFRRIKGKWQLVQLTT
ncbi:DUF4348 domain-containing protein [Segatella bryantii]|uniref:DUF4348 domain-containing protein n=1 Tax=Segatella bryantii TaxID=77095 RepID=UPI00241D9859|nr:DUF4348 domain-containing protein [Segatella bryantii]